MEPVIIKIQAGLGNQLFQYALGRSLELSHGLKAVFDTSWFLTQKKREYDLGHFRCKVTFADTAAVHKLQRYQKRPGLRNFLNNLFFADPKRYVVEVGFSFHPEILSLTGPSYLDGFWQSEKYFINVAQHIREECTLAETPDAANAKLLFAIQNSPAIALHVRRGDYVSEKHTNAFHGTSSLDYYQAAVKHIQSVEPNGRIFVFSDDVKWAKENLRLSLPTYFVDINPPNKGYLDLCLMAACRHHIIANSTFSWWGAWLAENQKQIVIAPKQWFQSSLDASDLVPARWIRM